MVWEPVLLTDWTRPASSVLSRIPDRRVIQFWDKTHQVARKLRNGGPARQPEPECCEEKGVLWDVAAVFGKDTRWIDSAPRAEFLNGPVFRLRAQITSALVQQLGR